jgi:hypothetical protein
MCFGTVAYRSGLGWLLPAVTSHLSKHYEEEEWGQENSDGVSCFLPVLMETAKGVQSVHCPAGAPASLLASFHPHHWDKRMPESLDQGSSLFIILGTGIQLCVWDVTGK